MHVRRFSCACRAVEHALSRARGGAREEARVTTCTSLRPDSHWSRASPGLMAPAPPPLWSGLTSPGRADPSPVLGYSWAPKGGGLLCPRRPTPRWPPRGAASDFVRGVNRGPTLRRSTPRAYHGACRAPVSLFGSSVRAAHSDPSGSDGHAGTAPTLSRIGSTLAARVADPREALIATCGRHELSRQFPLGCHSRPGPRDRRLAVPPARRDSSGPRPLPRTSAAHPRSRPRASAPRDHRAGCRSAVRERQPASLGRRALWLSSRSGAGLVRASLPPPAAHPRRRPLGATFPCRAGWGSGDQRLHF